jgi:hypothetical protein
MTFVLRLEHREQEVLRQLGAHVESAGLQNVAQRLFTEHNVRLLAVDCGLRFVLEAPTSTWRGVVEKQLAIQATLTELLPEGEKQAARWSDVTQYGDVDIHLGRPLSSFDPLTAKPQRQLMVDHFKAKPQRLFTLEPRTQEDRKDPEITSIVATKSGKILMADTENATVKMTELNSPNKITASPTLDKAPCILAALSDSQIAATTLSNVIYLLSVERDITVIKEVQTKRWYSGISGSSVDNTLIVSCNTDSDGPASVDIITHEGKVVKTVTDRDRLPVRGLAWPHYLCNARNRVFISEFNNNKVFIVDTNNGALLETLTHDHLMWLRQVCMDNSDNLYVASLSGHCVLVRSPRGKWRQLVGEKQSKKGYNDPTSVCISEDGVLVVAWQTEYSPYKSVVIGYKLT